MKNNLTSAPRPQSLRAWKDKETNVELAHRIHSPQNCWSPPPRGTQDLCWEDFAHCFLTSASTFNKQFFCQHLACLKEVRKSQIYRIRCLKIEKNHPKHLNMPHLDRSWVEIPFISKTEGFMSEVLSFTTPHPDWAGWWGCTHCRVSGEKAFRWLSWACDLPGLQFYNSLRPKSPGSLMLTVNLILSAFKKKERQIFPARSHI